MKARQDPVGEDELGNCTAHSPLMERTANSLKAPLRVQTKTGSKPSPAMVLLTKELQRKLLPESQAPMKQLLGRALQEARRLKTWSRHDVRGCCRRYSPRRRGLYVSLIATGLFGTCCMRIQLTMLRRVDRGGLPDAFKYKYRQLQRYNMLRAAAMKRPAPPRNNTHAANTRSNSDSSTTNNNQGR